MSLDLKSLSNDISNINGSINTINNNINATNTTISNSDKIYTTTNSGNAYSVSIPSVTALSDGLQRKIKFNADSTGNCTLNMSSLGTKAIRNGSGDQITDLKKNQNCIVVYNSSNDSFILLGKGGDLNNDDRLALITIANNAESYNSTTKSAIINSVNTSLNKTLSTNSTWNQIKSAIDDGSNFRYGENKIISSSHPTTNAPIDLASIRLELYNRIFPNDFSKIQIIKNNSTNVFGSANINTYTTGNATDEESIYLILNENMYPNADYKVILTKGSIKDKLNNVIDQLEYSFHTNPNPSVWVNNSNGLNTGRTMSAACGSQSAALVFGGHTGYNGANLASTEKFNGSSWSTSGDMVTLRESHTGCGEQNSALAFGGWSNATLNTSENFNGSTWSTSVGLNIKRYNLAGCGSQSSALAFGGFNGNDNKYNNTEKFNGSSWTTSGDMVTGKTSFGGCGEQNSALAFSGAGNDQPTTGFSVSTEKFNGTTWSTSSDMATGRNSLAGCGNQSSALAFGGHTGRNTTYMSASTEKFNGTTWTTSGDMVTARTFLAGCGTQLLGLSLGGAIGDTKAITNTEKFFG